MARKFLTPIDLNKLELQNAVIQNLATAPSSPVVGQIYFDTVVNELLTWNGTAWRQSDGMSTGLLSARPAAATANSGTFYYATDNFLQYYSNGTTWQQIDAFGSGSSSTLTIAGTAADGSLTTYARADHTHAGPGFGASTATTTYGLAKADGSATTVARSDHTHGTPSLSATAAGAVTTTTGTAGAVGTASDSGHTHGLTPSGFALSAFGVPTSSVSFNSQKITSLLDPTAAQDAATKAYVDSVAAGLNVHDGAVVATTANLAYTYTAGSASADGGTGVGATLTAAGVGIVTIDGRALVLNDRLLVKNQTTALQNGVYTVTTAGTAGATLVLTRSTDYDNHIIGQVMAGDFVFIAAGTTQATTTWVQSATGTSTTPVNGIKLGTDALTFTQFGAGATFTAGNGITLSGSAFSFAPLSTGGLTVGSTGATAAVLLPTNSGLGTSASGLAVGAGTGITVTTGTVNIDTTVVARKFSTTLSTSSTSYTVTHNLGTLDVHVQVYTVADGSEVMVDNLRATTNTVTINFATAPTANAYRVVVIG